MESSMRGHQVTTEMLLGKGANPNSKDRRGRSALAMAAYAGHREVVSTLVASGARADGVAKKLLAKLGLHSRAARYASTAGRERVLCSLAADPLNDGNGTRNAQKYTSRLDELRNNLRAPALQSYLYAPEVAGLGDPQSKTWTRQQLEELVRRGVANRADLSQAANSSDYQNLRRLATQGMNLWHQIQSEYPEMASMLQGSGETLGRIFSR
jgi:ankyrin repeat protein